MDTPKKPQVSEEEEAPALPVPDPSPRLPARSPFRPLSRRRRQAQTPEPPAVVERPNSGLIFDASPTTVSAALAKAGTSTAEPSLAWRAGENVDSEVTVEVDADEDGGAGTGSPE